MMETYTEFQQASEQTMALVVVNNAIAIKAKDAYFPPDSLTPARKSYANDHRAYMAGKAAGEKIPLRRGLSGERSNMGGQILLK